MIVYYNSIAFMYLKDYCRRNAKIIVQAYIIQYYDNHLQYIESTKQGHMN